VALAQAGLNRARLAAWSRATRRRVGRLELDAPHGPGLTGRLPRVELTHLGRPGDGVLRVRIGLGVRIGAGVVLEVLPTGTCTLELGDDVALGDGVHLLLRGGAIRLGAHTQVRAFSVLKAEGEIVAAGRNLLSYGSVVHCAQRVTLGERTALGEHTTIADSEHTTSGDDFYNAPLDVAPVTLGANVLGGAGAVYTRGTTVGDDCQVAAGAVLAGGSAYPARSLIAGVPARVVRAL
jgi:acetyltransferase-like isoleucine patch superfamily enzyme